ncbi:hypothetical protein [Ferrimicrobium sp.]|uniref:hypothetical protein n=1 Tax=Ferrimicrobium sp. TaxID=2926050 RepID=UPI0026381FF7|nr:hypothetical protein [Ferrimicrobium sp.]
MNYAGKVPEFHHERNIRRIAAMMLDTGLPIFGLAFDDDLPRVLGGRPHKRTVRNGQVEIDAVGVKVRFGYPNDQNKPLLAVTTWRGWTLQTNPLSQQFSDMLYGELESQEQASSDEEHLEVARQADNLLTQAHNSSVSIVVDGRARTFQTLDAQAYVIAQYDCDEYSVLMKGRNWTSLEGLELVRISDLEPFIMGYFNLFMSTD